MEFFEKAHVVKRKHDEDDDMKKQLKQMLYGYKQNDNELIRNAANIENEQDDSTSVSGFSDLNLTVSSTEETSTRQRISIIDPNLSLNSLASESQKSSHVDSDFEDNTSDKSSNASLSDIKDDIQSLSEEISLNLDDSRESDELDDDFSITGTSSEESEDIQSIDDEPFDSDGKLASEILKRLNMKETPEKSKKKKTKPKADAEPIGEEFSDMESDQSSVVSESEFDRHSDNSMNYTNVLSPSFVSVFASDMPNQSLSDVLGDYKYPTIRNLPSESQNVFATNKSGIFPTMDLDDSEINKPFDSLLPEVGSALDIDDEIPTDLETSTNMAVDESTFVCDTSQSDQTFQREASTESIETKFVNPAQVYYGKNSCILVLKHPTEIYMNGKVRVTLMGGQVEIGGYTLKDGKYCVFAPNYNCAQYLRTLEHNNGYYGLFGKLTGSGLSVAAAEEIVTSIGQHDSVVQLQRLNDRVSQFVENGFMGADLFTKISKNIDNCFKKASKLLGCSLYLMKPWKSLEENQCWKQVLNYGYKNRSRGILCGGKGSGKSTFLRYYVNRLLASGPVLVIDLDPGQCEFTVAGNVSATVVTEPLLGPSFTHLKRPERMLNIGLINTMDNTRRYLAAVKEIIAYCHSEERFRDLPWVVNTMGMCNGLGLQFMTLITIILKPTFMLQINVKNPKKRFEYYLNPHTVTMLYSKYQNNYLFRSISPPDDLDYSFVVAGSDSTTKSHSIAPRDERYLNFLAYFGSLVVSLEGSMDFLLGIVPYEVDLRRLYIAANVKVNTESIARVINGKIVALCKHGGDNSGKVFTLDDKPLRCYGHGLIRGIDEERGFCYVITPATAAELEEVNTLVYADWAPELGTPGNLPAGTLIPYRAPTEDHQRQLLSAPRRRYNPIQLIKTSRIPKVKASVS